MTRRVAVTGATGFIGWHVCERFRDAGWAVRAVVRPGGRSAVPVGIEPAAAPLELAALTDAFRDVDTIVHLAGITQARRAVDFQRVNVDRTCTVAEATRARGARLVYVSSQTAGGPAPAARPRTETDIPAPITPYAASKLSGEHVVRQTNGLSWTILRPTAVYGPRDRRLLPLFRLARLGVFPRLPNAASFVLDLVHVQDVARAIELAASSSVAEGETLFIGSGTQTTAESMLRELARACDRRYRPLRVPSALVWLTALVGTVETRFRGRVVLAGLDFARLTEARSAGFACSVERAQRCLGFRAQIGLTEGFQTTADWYRANRW